MNGQTETDSKNESKLDNPVDSDNDQQRVMARTHHWLAQSVIGLGLCPFARRPYEQGRVRIEISSAETMEALAHDLVEELQALNRADPASCETTVLVHPHVLQDFADYNDFLELADQLLVSLDLEGELQIASFHPDYQFADTPVDDPANCTNRSPFPILHLLREASIEQAVADHPAPEQIFERNMARLRELGLSGWQALMEDQSPDD